MSKDNVVQFRKLDDVEQCLEDAKQHDYAGLIIVGFKLEDNDEVVYVSGYMPKGMSKPHVRGIVQEAQDILFDE